jgi:hypothetical protein
MMCHFIGGPLDGQKQEINLAFTRFGQRLIVPIPKPIRSDFSGELDYNYTDHDTAEYWPYTTTPSGELVVTIRPPWERHMPNRPDELETNRAST